MALNKSASNAMRARVNETALARFLNQKKWPDSTTRMEYEKAVSELEPEDVKVQVEKAEEMAKSFIDHARQLGYVGVKGVYWIGVPGEGKRKLVQAIDPTGKLHVNLDPKVNPTDIMVEFARGVQHGSNKFGSWLGLSAKASFVKSGKIGFKNVGLGTMDDILHFNGVLNKEYKDTTDKFVKAAKLPEQATARNTLFKKDAKKYEQAKKVGDALLESLRDKIYNKLVRLSDGETHEHILKYWLNAQDETYPPYLKVTAGGERAPYHVKVEDPKINPKIDAMNKERIKFSKREQFSIQVNTNSERIFSMRLKFDSRSMAGSIKINGEPA